MTLPENVFWLKLQLVDVLNQSSCEQFLTTESKFMGRALYKWIQYFDLKIDF